MNPKEALQRIKLLFENMPIETPVVDEPTPQVEEIVAKVEMAEYSLANGTKVMISALEIGGKVELEDGTPAPMGEHMLVDGTKIVVDESGLIVSIESPKEETIEEVMPEQVAEPTPIVEEMTNKFNAQIEALEAKIVELEDKAKQGFAQVAELIEALSNVPKAEPTQSTNVGFSALVSTNDIKAERLEKYRNAILNNKK